MPAGQNSRGRQRSSVSLIQWKAPSTAGVVVTVVAASTAALSVTGSSNVSATGWPTPTVIPSRGNIDTAVWCVGVRVEKLYRWMVTAPAASAASAVTV